MLEELKKLRDCLKPPRPTCHNDIPGAKPAGPSLKTDMCVVERVSADIRMNAWKDTIRKFYGIKYSELAKNLATMPVNLIAVLETRLSSIWMKVWAKSENEELQKFVIDRSNKVIALWRTGDPEFERKLDEAFCLDYIGCLFWMFLMFCTTDTSLFLSLSGLSKVSASSELLSQD